MISEDELRRIVEKWIEQAWQRGDLSAVDELHSPGFVDHDPSGRPADNEGFKEGIASLFRAFSDLSSRIEDLVISPSEGKVAVRWSGSGTHSGPYMGAPPSGKKVSFKGIEILKIRDGLITDRWGEWDGIDVLVQLGRITL